MIRIALDYQLQHFGLFNKKKHARTTDGHAFRAAISSGLKVVVVVGPLPGNNGRGPQTRSVLADRIR